MSWQGTLLNHFLRATVKRRLARIKTVDSTTALDTRAHLELIARCIPPAAFGVAVEHIDMNGVSAERIMAPCANPDRAILYVHGGAYIMGSPRLYRALAARLSAAARVAVLVPAYRLAPEHPWPAALEDVRHCWHWLLAQGYASQQLIVAGDSAGGGLALAMLLDLRDRGDPLPVATIAFSPWTDLVGEGESLCSNAEADPLLLASLLSPVAQLYHAATDPRTPGVSPLYGNLHGLPPLLIHAGNTEILLSDSERFVVKAQAAGVHAKLKIWDHTPHVVPLFAPLLPEAKQCIQESGAYADAYFRAGKA